MAISKRSQATLLLSLVASLCFLEVSLAYRRFDASLVAKPPVGPTTCPVPTDQCSSACDHRCSNTSHKNNCLLFCNKCCNWCQCVPPGTFGQKDCCSCYRDWKTQEGGPKCP
uniref:Gibberellin-regulated protein 5-like n=1 Tax=Nicotiana sylvestris TaxID=4096 RepID=A0A1U7V3V6_NICSY|nr:PREDICTED: gibberellin-regulated protein 5-like [Nicotiana sylvestris]